MKIYLTRHGKTKWNSIGKMQGWKNSDLSVEGLENAKSLGKRLNNINFDYIYSSPLGRAIETAKAIKGDKETKIIINEGLKEMGFGIWEGMDHKKIKKEYPEQYYNFWNKPHLYQELDGESFDSLSTRVKNAFNEIINKRCENVLIVSHALVIKTIYSIINNRELKDFWLPPFIYDTCLTIIEINEDNEPKIILEADVEHVS